MSDPLQDLLHNHPPPWRVQTDAPPAEYLEIVDANGAAIVEWPEHMAEGHFAIFDSYVPAAELMAAAPLLLWLLAEARWHVVRAGG